MSRHARLLLLLGALCAVIAAGMLGQLLIGSPALGPTEVLHVIGRRLEHGPLPLDAPRPERLAALAVLDIRLPRLGLALLIGAVLGSAGALLQDALRNPLASPDVLGVSAGAALVVAAVQILHLDPGPLGPAPWATAVGLATGLGVLAASRGRGPETLVLFGAAAAAVLNGLVVAVVTLGAPADVGLLQQYLMGSLAARDAQDLLLVLPFAVLGMPLALMLGRRLAVLSLGDDVAAGLGVRPSRIRILAMVIGCVLVAATVAVAGPIGFVALLAAHLVRAATGLRAPTAVIAVSAVAGAAMLLGADALGRLLVHPREIAVGIWCALAGGPALLLALRRMHG